jgi:hypothetical protein
MYLITAKTQMSLTFAHIHVLYIWNIHWNSFYAFSDTCSVRRACKDPFSMYDV